MVCPYGNLSAFRDPSTPHFCVIRAYRICWWFLVCLSLRILPLNRRVTACSSKFTLISRTVNIFVPYVTSAGPSGRARGLRRGYADVRLQNLRFPIWPVHLSVVYCQVEVCVAGRSLVQRSPTECIVLQCDHMIEEPHWEGLGPLGLSSH